MYIIYILYVYIYCVYIYCVYIYIVYIYTQYIYVCVIRTPLNILRVFSSCLIMLLPGEGPQVRSTRPAWLLRRRGFPSPAGRWGGIDRGSVTTTEAVVFRHWNDGKWIWGLPKVRMITGIFRLVTNDGWLIMRLGYILPHISGFFHYPWSGKSVLNQPMMTTKSFEHCPL